MTFTTIVIGNWVVIVGFYNKAKRGISDAGLDLLDLAKAFENSYQERSMKPLSEGVRNYLDTQHAGTVLMLWFCY